MTSVASPLTALNGDVLNHKNMATSTIEPVQDLADALQPPLAKDVSVDQDDWVYPYPTDFTLEEKPIDEIRELKVAIIGAGLAGVTAGILLPIKVPGLQLTIFEKNADVGGTWFENVYPGVRCDVPAHVYQSSFAPNTQWTEAFARGAEIQAYWAGLAKKYNVYDKTRFQTKITSAHWKPEVAKWEVNVTDLVTGKQSSEQFDFLIPAIGHFNEWRLPEYPGMEDFKGLLRHSSNWDATFDAKGKNVAVIGNGASGIQVLPELQKIAGRVDHYARSRTWIAGSLGGLDREAEPMPYTPEQLEEFKDPAKYLAFRKSLEDTYWTVFEAQIRGSKKSQANIAKFKEIMGERLAEKPEILEKIVPDFPPNCRRLTPGPGYLEALCKPNVDYINTPISHFTATGIVTKDGVERAVDAVICSTGANVDFAPPFSIVNAEGIDLSRAWRPEGEYGFPYAYLGFATPGFPNLLHLHGPNAHGASGTVTHAIETQCAYIGALLRKVSSQMIRTVEPRKDATDEYITYCDAFFPRTNLSRKCSSWANGRRPGARIHGLWPGSSSHVAHVRRQPRWEDWEWQYLRPENRFAYWGNGWTKKEAQGAGDPTNFLKLEGSIDLRDLHEQWWDL